MAIAIKWLNEATEIVVSSTHYVDEGFSVIQVMVDAGAVSWATGWFSFLKMFHLLPKKLLQF